MLILLNRKIALLTLLLVSLAGATQAQTPAQPVLTPDEIVAKLAEHNRQRAANLKGYTSKRTYHLEYHGFPGTKEAEMVVEARYDAPATKEFKVISESGSKFVINRVFRKLLTSEQEALDRQNQQETAITPENYNFKLEREEQEGSNHYFVLKAEPKRKNKFLFRGLVWIDGKDFAVAKIDAQPATNPSFWISKTEIHHRYVKVGDFWLPAQNTSTTDVRLGGMATLTIDYGNYQVFNESAHISAGGPPKTQAAQITKATSNEAGDDKVTSQK